MNGARIPESTSEWLRDELEHYERGLRDLRDAGVISQGTAEIRGYNAGRFLHWLETGDMYSRKFTGKEAK